MQNRHRHWYDLFGWWVRNRKKILWSLSAIPILLLLTLLFYVWRADRFDLSEITAPPQTCAVYDRNGTPLGTLAAQERVFVTYQDLPQELINAFVAREDEDFFNHSGIVYSSLLRSLFRNVSSMSYVQGGSTITMQLARNCYELRDKSIDRKILEIALARRIESKYSKQDILVAYLNRIYFGRQCYGIAQAANTYFNKNVRDLNLAECATLAGLVRGPAIYNPIKNQHLARTVRNETLQRMFECGFISQEQLQNTVDTPVTVPQKKENVGVSYPISIVANELKEHEETQEYAETAGIFVISTLDLAAQRMVEETVETALLTLESTPAWGNLPKRTDNRLTDCVQTAVLCVKTGTGELLALTAGRSAIDGINRWQQITIMPGALFTPIVNLCAIDQRKTVIRSKPQVTGKGVGYQTVIDMAKKAGYHNKLPRSEQLFLGQFNVQLFQMAQALHLLANNGFDIPISAIKQIGTNKNAPLKNPTASLHNASQELLPRESVKLVKTLPPYQQDEQRRRILIGTELPNNTGFIHTVSGRQFFVFVWLGFDSPDSPAYRQKGIPKLLTNTCRQLADDIYTLLQAQAKTERSQSTDNDTTS